MLAKRIIPCLDVKDGRVVKGVNFINLIDAGDPVENGKFYDNEGADELVFLDITASSDSRDIILDMVPEINNLEQLPLAERILLVEDLWDSIARSHEADLPIPEWQKAELMRRKRKYMQNPDSVIGCSDYVHLNTIS